MELVDHSFALAMGFDIPPTRGRVTLLKLASKAIRMLIYPIAFSEEDREAVADAISEALGQRQISIPQRCRDDGYRAI